MLRNILVLFPALAFALPFISSQPTSARPLATPAPEADFQPGKQPTKPGKPGGGGDSGDVSVELALEFCTAIQVLVENRVCEVKAADACLAACGEIAVEPYCESTLGERAACADETVRSCRSACEADGAAFCDTRYMPGKKPGKKPGKEPGKKPGKQPTRPNDTDEEGGMIFINIEQCVSLGINVDLKD